MSEKDFENLHELCYAAWQAGYFKDVKTMSDIEKRIVQLCGDTDDIRTYANRFCSLWFHASEPKLMLAVWRGFGFGPL